MTIRTHMLTLTLRSNGAPDERPAGGVLVAEKPPVCSQFVEKIN